MTEIKIPMEIYSRCVGYYRPVNQWHKGKQEEFKDRLPYKFPKFQEDKNYDYI
jgi:anaerobic ribonucleoside-triphosphate reductase